MAPIRDARLLARVRRGDDAAFEQLHARHQPDVLAFCRHLTGSREDAEDAVQHAFLAAYRRIAESEDQLELRPWLFTVARNRCLSLLRARGSVAAMSESNRAVTSFDGLAREVESRQELRDLVRDLGRLPEPQRAALVLSQLDALSYRDIGTVLGVAPEKVKALVFQARSSLASTREAREAPCFEIRSELATARGSALRRRRLRRHVGQCDGCREFEVMVMRQRHDLDVLLPVAPSVGLGQAILGGAIGREAAGSAATGLAVGGGATSLGTLTALGLGGAAKLAVGVAIVGGGGAVALAADVPERLEHAGPWRADRAERVAGGGSGSDGLPAPGGATPRNTESTPGDAGARRELAGRPLAPGMLPHEVPLADAGDSYDSGSSSASDPRDGDQKDGPASDLPHGLAKRAGLPPELAKREEVPPGLGKRGDAPPGRSRTPKQPGAKAPANGKAGGGQGNGNTSPGAPANGNAGGGGPGGPGSDQGAAGGEQGNAGGQGNGNVNGSSGGQGNGNAGGQGNAGGTGNGNGGGNPH